MLAEALATFTRRKKLENTYSYGGGIVTILASGKDTAGAFSLLESMQKPGSEPPMHSHQNEDELFYILEGVVHLTVDGVVHELSAGDTIFLPRGIPHTFRIKSGVARALTLISPSGFERWFQTIGTPAKNFDLPELTGPPSAETLERMKLLAAESGLRIVDNPSGR